MSKKILFTIFVLFLFVNLTFAKNKENDESCLEYVNIPFWEHFNDGILVNNMLKVYENNHDLKAAASKVNQVRSLVKISFSNELPHIGFEGYTGYISNSSNEIFGGVVIPNYHEARFLLPLTYSYDVDIWGKNRLRTKSEKKSLEMIEQDEKALYISLTSAFANIYFNLIKADKLIEYQKEIIEVENKITKDIEKRYEYGTATINDVLSAQKSLTYRKEELENLLEKQDALQNELSVMLADNSFDTVERNSFENLNVDVRVPKAIDVSLLDNRPDRIKTELNLEKNRIDIKAAKRDFLPTFKIAGNVGFNFYNISSAHTFLSDIGVVPNLDLFSGGRKLAILKLQKDRYNLAIEEYENAILKSIQETNDSLYQLKSARAKYMIAGERQKYDKNQFSLAVIREDAGMADDLDLLIKKEALLLSNQELVSSKINEIAALIELYRAVGGADFYNNTELL